MGKQVFLPICLVVAATATTMALSGCLLSGPDAPRDIPNSVGMPASQTSKASTGPVAASVASDQATPSKPSGVSAKSLARAQSIGGSDYQGQTFNFIVGGSFGTEAEAQAALDKALPLFGNAQPYFIVQRSDSFAGMKPGSWVVVEAHFKTPTKANLASARRGFPSAHVERARVIVSDPIPVYEDFVGGD